MLDIQFVRDHPDLLQNIARQKGINVDIDALLRTDEERRTFLHRLEGLRQQRNQASKEIASFVERGESRSEAAERLKAQVRAINVELKEVEPAFAESQQTYDRLMELVPNIVSPDTPIGESDADNVEVRRFGEVPQFEFNPVDHVTLGTTLDLIDIPRGVKVAGTRGYFLKNAGLQLHRAVQQLAIDLLSDRGFTPMDVPVMVREGALSHTGFFPLGVSQTYQLPDDDLWLVGTAEASLVSYFSNEIVDVTEPIRVAGVSNCFRREAGSAGRDVRGLYRVHQFAKVEQVVLCQNDLEVAEQVLSDITQNAEDLLQALELPYRVVAVCTGDMSQKNYKQFDIETWMPSRGIYGETHSSSLLLDFQARRANIRYRDTDGQLQFCYTLNNTAVASPRILIPLLEVHQQADGSIKIPRALQPYMRGLSEIRQI